MFSTTAELEYFRDFQHFSIGNFTDGGLHYNGKDMEEEEEYSKQINDLFLRFSLEIETNLIYLVQKKSESIKYLSNVERKLLKSREKMYEFEYEIYCDNEIDETEMQGGNPFYLFRPNLWKLHLTGIENLTNYCRTQLAEIGASIGLKRGRRQGSTEIIPWKGGEFLLGTFYTWLKIKQFISDITLRQFELHFKEITNARSSENIDWLKEKYLLSYLFDELLKKKLLDDKFKLNCDALLSKHFLVKGKLSSPNKFTSARNFYKTQRKVSRKQIEAMESIKKKLSLLTHPNSQN